MMFCAVLVVLLLNCDLLCHSISNNNTVIGKSKTTRRTIVSLIFSKKPPPLFTNSTNNKGGSCRWLKGFRKQNKQCQGRKGFANVLETARSLAVSNCEEQFRYDRWDCSYKKAMFQKVYRETAFMYAIAASSVMYATAKACNDGKLHKCYCAEVPRRPRNGNWQWGGCGDNTKKARKIANRFLHLSQDIDGPTEILNYNTNIGFKAVKENEMKVCVCHGVSASCALKTCWKVIKPFPKIAEDLKKRYHSASVVKLGNQISSSKPNVSAPSGGKLIYLAYSPNFCETTVGRKCRNQDHCATLCCGRGYNLETVNVTKRCDCRLQHLNFTCGSCKVEEDEFICK